jgi:uncharacterized YccA/Bax inhibitor family protein
MDTSNPLLSRDAAFSRAGDELDTMTLGGVINKTSILLLLCVGAGAYSWMNPEMLGLFMVVGIFGGLIAFMVGLFKPSASPVAAPAYAVLEGLCLGGVSRLVEAQYPGIVVNTVMLTFGVLALMLALYATRTIRVTDGLVKGIVAATFAVFLVYMADMALNLFGIKMPYLHQSGPIGIGISLVVVAIAAFNLLLDFRVIEDRITARSPRYMEWYCGMALLVTLIWLYLEILRLLSKLRSR